MSAVGPDRGHREQALVAFGFALMLVHNLDEAFGHPEDGGKGNLAVGLVLAALVIVLFSRMTRRWRLWVLGLLGLNAVLQGGFGHVAHLLRGDPTPLDWSGLLFVAGGLLLIAIAIAEFRRPRRATRRAAQPSDSWQDETESATT